MISGGTHFCYKDKLSQKLIFRNYKDKCGWFSLVSIKITLFEGRVREAEISFSKSQVFCIHKLIEAQGRQLWGTEINRIKAMFNYSTLILFWFLFVLILFLMAIRKSLRSQKAGSNAGKKRIKSQDKCIVYNST